MGKIIAKYLDKLDDPIFDSSYEIFKPGKKVSNLNRSRNPMDFDFNDVEPLSRFVTESGKILPRKETGLSAKLQRRITKLIKQGRNMLTLK